MRTEAAVRASTLMLLSCVPLFGCDRVDNFDDCILKHMENVTSDSAAASIHRSCREKFPRVSKTIPSRTLDPWEFHSLTGRAGLAYGNTYSGNAYNGNPEITITRIRFRVTATVGEETTVREYWDEVLIPPLETRDFSFDIVVGDKGAEYSWGIVGAEGYDT